MDAVDVIVVGALIFSRLQVYTDIVRRAAETYGPNSKELDTALHNIDDIMQAKLLDIRSKKQVQNMKVRLIVLFLESADNGHDSNCFR